MRSWKTDTLFEGECGRKDVTRTLDEGTTGGRRAGLCPGNEEQCSVAEAQGTSVCPGKQ